MKRKASSVNNNDGGHRHGNYHNYYAFHPTAHRMEHLQDVIECVGARHNKQEKALQYCDLGCNEGDLTLEIASALQKQCNVPVHFLGIDMDDVLIQRANEKKDKVTSPKVTGEFVVGNVCTDLDSLADDNSVDITSLLSTTMWIHVHAGDEGLRKVLEQTCQKTRQFLLVEPQPSKCYRRVMKRLRRMGLSEIDVSSDRLKLRPNIEEEIDAIIQSNGFEKVFFSTVKKTEWNRTLELYERTHVASDETETPAAL